MWTGHESVTLLYEVATNWFIFVFYKQYAETFFFHFATTLLEYKNKNNHNST